ncbi:MAG: radical SAM protein [Dehalococcoidales bacterium]|nr:radical SAM protein [Dehalococcoidales bacterium]
MRSVRVQLVFGPPAKPPRFGELGEQISPPLGILYLAAYLRREFSFVDIDVVDGVRCGYNHTLRRVRDFQPDILGLSFYTTTALGSYKLINEVKAERPQLLVIAGGPHVTAIPEDLLLRSAADLAVMGEGEETLAELLAAFIEVKGRFSPAIIRQVNGIAYREDGRIARTMPRSVIRDLDSIPFPARDLIDMREYSGWYVHKRLPETKMISTRGCPFYCTFCASPVWKTSKPWIRVRSPRNVVDEIEQMMDAQGIREYMDDCDEFNASLDNAIGICEELKRRKLDIPWKAQLRAHPLPEELVRRMAESGCWYVHLGIESGNNETLKGIQKKITLDQVVAACKLLHKYDIKVMGLFMIYNVWEEDGQLRFEDTAMSQRTLDFADSLLSRKLLDHVNWSITTPYPGSKLYNIARRHGLIKQDLTDNWDAWISSDWFVMRWPGISEAEQARLKTRGMARKAWLLLKSGNVSPKDLGFFAKKAIKVVATETQSRLQTGRREPQEEL